MGLGASIDREVVKEAGFSGWCAVFWGRIQRDRGEKRAKRCFNGGGCYGNRGFIRLIPNFDNGIFHGIDGVQISLLELVWRD